MKEFFTLLKSPEYAAQLQSLEKILVALVIFAVITAIFIGIIVGKIVAKLSLNKYLKDNRVDAVKRSRAVLGGQMVEQIAPFLPGFPCNPGDVRFVGKPVDFVAFPGMAQGEPVKEVMLIEVKTGSSQLSLREKEIQKAVEEGRVSYKIFSFSNDNKAL